MVARKKQKIDKAQAKVILGDEPQPKENPTHSDIVNAYNWYNYFYSANDATKFVYEWLKKEKRIDDSKILKTIDQWRIDITLSTIARLKNRGWKNLPDHTEKFFHSNIERLIAMGKKNAIVEEKVVDDDVYKPTVQDRMKEIAGDHIAEIEEAIDNFDINGKSDFSVYDYLKEKSVKAPIAKKIAEYYFPLKDELNLAVKGDKDVIEAYEGVKKKHLKDFSDFVNTIVRDVSTWAENQKTTRKPRKKKPRTVEQVIKNVNYKTEDHDYKIASVDPSKVIGMSQLWVFNTKTRILGVYNASTSAGLTFKGTTLQNFDQATSIGKTIRKPDVVLAKLKKAGKVALRKILPSIKAVEKEMNGRINADTILLKVIK